MLLALDFGFGLWSVEPCMAENGAGDQVNPQEGDQPEGNQQDGGQDPNLEGRVALLVDRALELVWRRRPFAKVRVW